MINRDLKPHFEAGFCQNCGGERHEWKETRLIFGLLQLCYIITCDGCKFERVLRWGCRDRDPDVDKRTGLLRKGYTLKEAEDG